MPSQELEDEERATLEDLVVQAVALHLLRVLVLEPLTRMLLSGQLPSGGWEKAGAFKVGDSWTKTKGIISWSTGEMVAPRKRPDPLGCAR